MSEELPPGWTTAVLGDLVTHKSGNSQIIKGKMSDRPEEGLVQGFSASGPDVWVPRAEFEGEGIVVSAVGHRCGKAFLASGSWTAIANTHVVRPGPALNVRFLWYLINDEKFWIRGGSAQPFIKVKATLERKLPLPLLAEQQRIVTLLEGHLSGIEAASGYLSSAERRANLMQRTLIDEVMRDVVTRGCPIVAVRDAAAPVPRAITDGPFGSHLTSAHYVAEPGVQVIRLQNIGDGWWKPAEAFISSDHGRSLQQHEAVAGDVVVASLGELVPRAVVVPDLPYPAIVKADCIRIRPAPAVDPRWLVACCRSTAAKTWAAERMKGVGRQRLGLKGIAALPIPLPSLADQRRLLDRLDDDQEALRVLQRELVGERRKVDALRRALLTAAFSGRL